jgi:AcrR family transcriptional regulator
MQRGSQSVADLRVQRTRANLRDALLRLLQKKPLESISVRDIVAMAGQGYTTYFRYYPNKEALLGEIAVDEVCRLNQMTAPVYWAKSSHAACLAVCTYVDDNRAVWSALFAGAMSYVRTEMLRLGRQNIAAAATRSKLPKDLGLVLGVAVIVELLAWWLSQPDPPSVAHIAEIMHGVAVWPTQRKSMQKRLD